MAISMVSVGTMVLTSAAWPLFALADERFIVLREKSYGRLQPDMFIRLGVDHQPLGRSGAD